MIRLLLINPLIIAIAIAIGVLTCKTFGADAHLREMLIAACICLAAAELAAVPSLFIRKGTNAIPAFQAALMGTVLHLGVVLVLGIVVIAAVHPPRAFVYWLLPLYWVTLIGMCIAFALTLRTTVQSTQSGNRI